MIQVNARLLKKDQTKVLCGYPRREPSCNQILAHIVAFDDVREILVFPFEFSRLREGVIHVSQERRNSKWARQGLTLKNRRPVVGPTITGIEDGVIHFGSGEEQPYNTLRSFKTRLPVAVRCPNHERDVINILSSAELGLTVDGFRNAQGPV